MIRDLYRKVRDAWPVNRVVVALTALLAGPLAALSGYVATYLADNVPGVVVDESWLAGIFVAGAAAGLTAILVPVYKWLDGWAKYEAREHENWRDGLIEVDAEEVEVHDD